MPIPNDCRACDEAAEFVIHITDMFRPAGLHVSCSRHLGHEVDAALALYDSTVRINRIEDEA